MHYALLIMLLEGPPGFFLAGVGMLILSTAIIFRARVGLIDEMTPLLATGDHAIDGTPVRETTYITVVDKEICLQLTREVRVVVGGLLRIVAIGGIELYASLTTPLKGLVQEFTLTTGPEHHAMAIGNEHLQRLNGEGALLADLGVFILDNRSVEINSDNH